MAKYRKFNTTGVCVPALHYMVDTSDTVNHIIETYIENGEYFTMNRARQYGKTTTLEQLYQKLKETYIVLDISFEAADDCFVSLYTLAQGFAIGFPEYKNYKLLQKLWKRSNSDGR